MANVITSQDKFSKPKFDTPVLYETSTLFSPVGRPGIRYNSDDLVGKQGLAVYSKMMQDEQVKAVTEFKLASIIARGWEFKFEDGSKLDEEEQKLRIQQLNALLGSVKGSFTDVLEDIATAREMGFSITEKIYSEMRVGPRTMTGFSELRLRDPTSFRPTIDPQGTLQKLEQYVGGAIQTVDMQRVVHHVHKRKWDLFYGRSELRSAYRWWYVKEQVMKMWALYLEKFGAGFAAISRTDTAPTPGSVEYESLRDAIKNMKALTGIILPIGTTMEMHYPSAANVYQECLQFCDLAIAKSQLVPNLLGISHQGQTGARALGDTQFEAFVWTTKSDADRLEAIVNEQMVWDLGDQNWGDDEYPCFRFKPASAEHLKWMLGAWKDLLSVNAVISSEKDEAYIRELLEMPEREPDEVLRNPLQDEKDAQAQANLEMQMKQDQQNQQDKQNAANAANFASIRETLDSMRALLTREGSNVNVQVSTPGSVTAEPTFGNAADRHRDPGVEPHGDLRGMPREVFDRAAERVAFSTIEQRTESIATHSISTLAGIVAKATRNALGSDENLKSLTDEDPSDVATTDISNSDKGKLKRAFNDLLGRAFDVGAQLATGEIDRARAQQSTKLSRGGKTGNAGVLERRQTRVHLASLRDSATAYFDTQAFRMAGDSSDQVRKVIQQRLQNAIKFGTPLADVRADIWDALVSKGLTTRDAARGVETDDAVNSALDDLWQDTEEGAAAYLSTLVRTNTFEALNEARFNEFTDPALSDFVLALRYAAVLDSSTTEICQELNDSVFAADSDEWDVYRPPNHFNCRSILVPITAVDGWDGVESDPPDVQPQEGFK